MANDIQAAAMTAAVSEGDSAVPQSDDWFTMPEPEAPAAAPKPADDAPAAPATPAAPAAATPAAVAPPSAVPSPAPVDARDFTDIDPEHIPLLKQMSNDAYNMVSALLRDKKRGNLIAKEAHEKALAEAAASRWQDHPEGYLLTEDYRKAVNDYQLADSMIAHWEAQLDLAKEGKPFNPLIQQADGQWMVNPNFAQPSTANIRGIERAIRELDVRRERAQAAHDSIVEQHKQGHSKQMDPITPLMDVFKPYRGNAQYEAAVKTEISKMPLAWRTDPRTVFIANTLAAMPALLHELATLRAAKSAVSAAPPAAGTATAMPSGDVNDDAARLARVQKYLNNF